MKARMPASRIRYTQVPNGIVTFGLAFSSVFHPLLIFPNSQLLCRGQGGRALNYQLSTGPPTKSNRNYEPVTRPRGPVSPLFFLPRLLPPAPPYGDLFRTCTRMKNNARIGEVCHQAAGTLHIREAEHTWAPRGAQHLGAERSGPAGRLASPRDEVV